MRRHRRSEIFRPGVSDGAILAVLVLGLVACGSPEPRPTDADIQACSVARDAESQIKAAQRPGSVIEPTLRKLLDDIASAAASARDDRIVKASQRIRSASELLSKSLAADDILIRCDRLLPKG